MGAIMFSKEIELLLFEVFKNAQENFRPVTVDFLLLHLLEVPIVQEKFLRASIDVDQLRCDIQARVGAFAGEKVQPEIGNPDAQVKDLFQDIAIKSADMPNVTTGPLTFLKAIHEMAESPIGHLKLLDFGPPD
ncbi:MAG: hypothetical protein KAY04_00050 [Burkholderiales bacterium]|nr:hypothetical protein [Burkholderiales bacterium]